MEQDVTALDRAKNLINQYCEEEFLHGSDFDDLTDIGVGFTFVTDDDMPIYASVDLVHFRLERYLDGWLIENRQYDSLEALIEGELMDLDFDDLTYASDEEIARITELGAKQPDKEV